MITHPPPMSRVDCAMELDLFLLFVELSYEQDAEEYPMISKKDLQLWSDRMRNGEDILVSEILLPGLFESLIQSAMAHFLYHQKNNLEDKKPDLKAYHPNYIRLDFMDRLVESKGTVSMGAFTLYEFTPGSSPIDRNILMLQIQEYVKHTMLLRLIETLVAKLQKEGSQMDRILGFVESKKRPYRVIGWLYFILIDIYLPLIDRYISELIKNCSLTCLWERSLNTAILCAYDKKGMQKSHEVLDLDNILPAWGLRAKVRSGFQGGRVVRPWHGKLYISKDGKLRWKRPESIVGL